MIETKCNYISLSIISKCGIIDAFMLKIPAVFEKYLVYPLRDNYLLQVFVPSTEEDVKRGIMRLKDISAVIFDVEKNRYYAYTGKYKALKDVVDLYVLAPKTLTEDILRELFIEIAIDYTSTEDSEYDIFTPSTTFASVDLGKQLVRMVDVNVVCFSGEKVSVKTIENVVSITVSNPIKKAFNYDPYTLSYSLDEDGFRMITLRDDKGNVVDLTKDLGDYDALYIPLVSAEKPVYIKKDNKLDLNIPASEIINKLFNILYQKWNVYVILL